MASLHLIYLKSTDYYFLIKLAFFIRICLLDLGLYGGLNERATCNKSISCLINELVKYFALSNLRPRLERGVLLNFLHHSTYFSRFFSYCQGGQNERTIEFPKLVLYFEPPGFLMDIILPIISKYSN